MTNRVTPSTPVIVSSTSAAPAQRARLDWIDVLRLLAMLTIVGFHWLRTGQENGAFGFYSWAGFEDVKIGFSQMPYLITDRSGLSLTTLVNNAIGMAFGYGWEAVNVFVLLSGLGLALSYRPDAPGFSLGTWYGRRFLRILTPYYVVAFVLILLAEILKTVGDGRSGLLGALALKLTVKNLPDPLGVEALKHLLLLDPRQASWAPFFFSPAWWFIPAILVAYACFPLFWRGVQRLGARTMLIGALPVSMFAYWLTDHDLLWEHGAYFVVFHECFNFTLGIVIGRALGVAATRQRMRALVASPACLMLGLTMFAFGNVANWFSLTYPLSSALFTPGYTLLLAWVAVFASRSAVVLKASRAVDSYYIYLLHQFLAFPLMLMTVAVCQSVKLDLKVGFGLGFVLYLVVCAVVVIVVERFWTFAEPRLMQLWPKTAAAAD